jgi:hypothetical protein
MRTFFGSAEWFSGGEFHITHLNIFRVSGEIEIQQTLMSRDAY